MATQETESSCPYDTKCTNPNCPYKHSTRICPQYDSCTIYQCGARHGPTRRPACDNPFNCDNIACLGLHPLVQARPTMARRKFAPNVGPAAVGPDANNDPPAQNQREWDRPPLLLKPANHFFPTVGKMDAIQNPEAPINMCRYSGGRKVGKCRMGELCRFLHLNRTEVPPEKDLPVPPKGYVWHDRGLMLLIHCGWTAGKEEAERTGRGKICRSHPQCKFGNACKYLHMLPSEDESMFRTESDGMYRVLSETKGGEQSKRKCSVCGDATTRGIYCAEGHFMCDECLSRYITVQWAKETHDLGSRPSVPCPIKMEQKGEQRQKKCTSPPFPPMSLARHLSPEALSAYVKVCQTAEKDLEGQEMLSRMFKDSAYMCPKCKHGPIDYAGCPAVRYHQGEKTKARSEETGKASVGIVNNSCPSCGFIAKEEDEYMQWDGVLRPVRATSDPDSIVNNPKLRQLLEMGFSLHEARGALTQHANVEDAAAFIAEVRAEAQRYAADDILFDDEEDWEEDTTDSEH